MRFRLFLLLALATACVPASTRAATRSGADTLKSGTFDGLEFRLIGPAFTSGRVIDVAVDPTRSSTWYVAVASGGVWKTTNAGTTWSPIFDDQGSYSIGCVTLDPKHPLTVWVGSGENNSQRSVGYGDGVYKSTDGGKTWANMGLKGSEHIGRIVIDPRNPDVVYVAAQGPLWTTGGERGLYKTSDGGKTWTRILNVDERTGISEIHLDPRDPDVMYAVAYERHRRVWTLIDGGPGSGLHKSVDGGKTWKKLESGLPKDMIGRIGLAISPANPDVVYAIVEASNKAGGVYRSTNAGASWEKRAPYVSSSPQYYQELIADPKVVDRVYSMDTFLQVTYDGGKTWQRLGEADKHVDNHALWIDPDDATHLINGCDGGLYQSWDRGTTWSFFGNLPITQYYKVAVDNSLPFYYVYGGTQDNNTHGGPSRTTNTHGIRNSDWFITTGGDGFACAVDPEDPNIVYSEAQHGELVRFDRKSGEQVGIQPQPEPGEPGSRWNWDSPLLISPHVHTRLYFASQRLYRSDDRGDTWKAVSPDLTRQIDRNKLKVAGRVWSVDAPAKNASTSFYGNLVSLTESPKKEGLLYLGSDDGLVQVSEDGGGHWRRIEKFPGVPDRSYVSRLMASQHDADVIYAAFDNHKNADFRPYVLRSNDRGKSWTSVAGNLPPRGTVYCLAEDHVDPNLLFAGTEFGVFATVDGGRHWTQLKGGLPTIQVRDMVIQKRENDLVLATFGRGFYVLDDYTPLRKLDRAQLAKGGALYPVKPTALYMEASPFGGRGKSSQGAGFYVASNPPYGATFTYHLKDELKTRRKARLDREKEAMKKGGDVFYPSWDSLRTEDREEEPTVLLTVSDAEGHEIRELHGPVTAGFHRVAWDLRYPPANPTADVERTRQPWEDPPTGPILTPGTYQVSLAQRVAGKLTSLGTQRFEVVPLDNATLPAKDRPALLAWQRKIARLQRAVLGAVEAMNEAKTRVSSLEKALVSTPEVKPELGERARAIEDRLDDLKVDLTGDEALESRNEPTAPSVRDRVQRVVDNQWNSSSELTQTGRRAYEIASQEFSKSLATLRSAVSDLEKLESDAETAGAPWTPGRVPVWQPE